MLILGELDDNVDPSTTFQVVNALIGAGKEFEFVVLPNQRHTMGGAYVNGKDGISLSGIYKACKLRIGIKRKRNKIES